VFVSITLPPTCTAIPIKSLCATQKACMCVMRPISVGIGPATSAKHTHPSSITTLKSKNACTRHRVCADGPTKPWLRSTNVTRPSLPARTSVPGQSHPHSFKISLSCPAAKADATTGSVVRTPKQHNNMSENHRSCHRRRISRSTAEIST